MDMFAWKTISIGLHQDEIYLNRYGILNPTRKKKILDGLRRDGFESLLQEFYFFKSQHKEKQRFQFWQEGNHPQEIQDENMMHQKLDYIHQNPVRRGYVDKPEDWRYSSARNYIHGNGLMHTMTQW